MSNEVRRELGSLVRLAGPLAAAHAGLQLMGVVDAAVVGRMGATELGAIGVANAVFFFFSIFAMGLLMGIDPLAAQALGAGDAWSARRALWQGIWLSIIVGVILMIPMLFGSMIFARFGIPAEVANQADAYLSIRLLSLIPLLLYTVLRGYLQARQITGPIVWSIVIGNLVNLVLDIVLVFGGGVLPEWTGSFVRSAPAMGIRGAAIASVISALLQVALLAAGLRLARFSPRAESHRRIATAPVVQAIRVGLPIALQMALEVGIFALAGLLAGRLGERAVAAHQLALQLAAFTYTAAMGIGAAASVRVGRAVGALDQRATRTAGLLAFALGAAVMSVAALAFVVWPGELARLMTDDDGVIATAVPLLLVAAVFQISDGIQGVGAGVLRGAGDTAFTFYANLVGHWLIGLPIALWLGFSAGHGVTGLWWGLCTGLTVVAVVLTVRFLQLSSRPIEPLVRGQNQVQTGVPFE